MPIIIAGLAVATTLIPLAIGYANTPAGTSYSGFSVDTSDNLSYIAAMRQGAHGSWLWHDTYTTEPQTPALIYFLYLALGHLQALTSLPPLLVFHLARIAFGVALVIAVYFFCGYFFTQHRARRVAFLLSVFGGGIGVLVGALRLGRGTPVGMDWSVAGSGVYPILANAPHYAVAALAVVVLLSVAIAGPRQRPKLRLGVAIVTATALVLIYPQLAILVVGILLTTAIWQRSRWPSLVAVAVLVPAVPYLVYAAYLRDTNPVVANWEQAGAFPVGDPLSYLLVAHTVPVLALALALATQRIRWPQKAALPVLWIAWVGLLCFLPLHSVSLGRVFYAISIPFGILGAWGLLGSARLLRHSGQRSRAVGYGVVASSLISFYVLAYAVHIPLMRLDPSANYALTDMRSALEALGHQPDGAVMNTFVSGIFVPPYSGHDTFSGNSGQTIDATRKEAEIVDFYAASGATRAAFMRSHHLRYILLGPAERHLVADQRGPGFTRDSHFLLVAASGLVEIYQLR